MAFASLKSFNDLLLAYQRIERVVYVPGTDRWENDVEHSYMLTMLAWYLIEKDKLPLSVDFVLKYALLHDLVEVFAGDTYIYDAQARATKHEREAAAALRLGKEYPDFASMHTLIAAYEAQEDPESRFVRALDKMQPVMQVYVDGGRLWKEKGITLAMLIEHKQQAIDRSPEVQPYFDSLVAELAAHPELFSVTPLSK